MPQPLHEFLQDEYAYLRSREGRDFFLALSPYATALNSKPEIRGILEALEAEALKSLERFVAEQNELIEEAKAIRADLAARAPEIDNSDMEPPDDASHERWRYELDSFANFDRIADAEWRIGYPVRPGDDDEPRPVGDLLGILRGRFRAATLGEDAGINAEPIRTDLTDLGRRIGNLGERNRAAVQRFRHESRTLPGMALARLVYFGSDLVAEPVQVETEEDVGRFLDRSLREWGRPRTLVRQLVSGERLEDWEKRSVDETEQILKMELERLHRELLRRLPSDAGVVRTVAVPPLPERPPTLPDVNGDTPVTFEEFVDLMLAWIADGDQEQPGAFIDVFEFSDALKQDVPDTWVFDATRVLEDRGLISALRAMGRAAQGRLTGEGRLYAARGGATGVIEQYRSNPTNFVVVTGSGHQVAVGVGGDVTQTSVEAGVPEEAWQLLDEIEKRLRADDSIDPSAREEAVADVQTARAQLERAEPNKRAAVAMLDPLAKLSSVASFVAKLVEMLASAA